MIRQHLFTIIYYTPYYYWHSSHTSLPYSGLYVPTSNVYILLVYVYVIIYILSHQDYATHIVSRVVIRYHLYNIIYYTPYHYPHSSHIALTYSDIALILTILLTSCPHWLTEVVAPLSRSNLLNSSLAATFNHWRYSDLSTLTRISCCPHYICGAYTQLTRLQVFHMDILLVYTTDATTLSSTRTLLHVSRTDSITWFLHCIHFFPHHLYYTFWSLNLLARHNRYLI